MKVDSTLLPTGPADQRMAAAAIERAGYDGLWAAEVQHDPFLTLASVATATKDVALGTGVALAFARNPMSVAVAAHDLQALSGGRLILGLGTQVKPHITRRFSMPWTHPVSMMREFVGALHAIWDCWEGRQALDFRGRYYEHSLMNPMFVPPDHGHGRPPVVLAGVGQPMTRLAGEVADGFLCHAFTSERYLREVTLPALAAGRGGDLCGFRVMGTPIITTGRTEQEYLDAIRAMRKQTAFYASTPSYRAVLEAHGWEQLGDDLHALSRAERWDEMGQLIDDDMLGAFTVVGEPEQIAPQLVARFGHIFERCTLYTPYPTDAQMLAEIASHTQRLIGERPFPTPHPLRPRADHPR